MQTYYIKKYNGKWTQDTMKAANIDNVRKRLYEEDRGELRFGITVKVKKGKAPGAPLNTVGTMYSFSGGGLGWKSRDYNMHRVSKKTGALLDWDKYWRYV